MTTLDFVYLPVPELATALAFYRDTLGWEEGWREGDGTATVKFPGGGVQLMIDVDTTGTLRSGPMLMVDDCRAWLVERAGKFTVAHEPVEMPGGWWAAFADPFGNVCYVADQSAVDRA